MLLSNGLEVVQIVILNEDNGWSTTVNNLPTKINHEPVTYAWSEQDIVGYRLTSVSTEESMMIFTNTVWTGTVPEQPKTPGSTRYTYEDYETPL